MQPLQGQGQGQGQKSMKDNLKITAVKAIQAANIGNPNPPNMSKIKQGLMESASPISFSLPLMTGTNNDVSDATIDFCRKTYTGFGGLRQLQKDQTNQTYFDSGCGWRFQQSDGTLNPSINQAAYGNFNTSLKSGLGEIDEIGGSISWNMELEMAERDASRSVATQLNQQCTNLQYLSADNKNFFGFCKNSGSIIPIEKDIGTGKYSARFPNDNTMNCLAANIIPAVTAPSACLTETTQGSSAASASASASASSPAKFKNYTRESFTGTLTSINDLEKCTSPLTRDCVVLAARASGCDTKGSLITALQGAQAGDNYSKLLQTNNAYTTYMKSANPSITSAILTNGTASIATALNDFANLAKNVQSSDIKLAAASRDLCIKGGFFDDSYDWCSENTPTTIITKDNIVCAQISWKQNGGTGQGSSYPLQAAWQGKTFQSLQTFIQNLIARMNSTDKVIQDDALQQFIGTSSGYIAKPIIPAIFIDNSSSPTPMGLDKNSKTNGAETVWIDLGDYWNASTPPLILRCDLKTAEHGEIIPTLTNDYSDLKTKYNLPKVEGIAFINAFEYRPVQDTTLQFAAIVDDGFMISLNQNPFENTNYAKNDWGSWKYQPPTPYTSGLYNITADSETSRNIIVTKFFQGQGGAHFIMNLNDGNKGWQDQSTVTNARANMYLTQEPLAPWLQYEICTRPNDSKGTTLGFFEKRWNGPVAFYENQGINNPIPSFDVVFGGGIVAQTDQKLTATVPGGKSYLSFITSSWWHTKALFAFTAFKAITILIRPMANLSANANGTNVFTHMDARTYNLEISNLGIKTVNGQYVFYHESMGIGVTAPCVTNEWNLIVIQYNGDVNGITNVQIDAMDLPTLKTQNGLAAMFSNIMNHQSKVGKYIARSITNEAERTSLAGYLQLGGMSDIPQGRIGFTGDIAWLHGFRTPIAAIEMLYAEVNQTWASRWPRPNIDAGFIGAPSLPKLAPVRSNCVSSYGQGVTIRQNCDSYSGWSKMLPVGEYDLTQVPNSFPIDTSYIIVPSGFKATIFTGPLGKGQSKSFEGPTEWNFCNDGGWANDKIVSISVTAGAGNSCYTSENFTSHMTAQPNCKIEPRGTFWKAFKW